MICPLFSECTTESLSHAVNTYFSKSNKLEKHLGIMPRREITPVFFHFIDVINKLLTATTGEFFLKSISLFELQKVRQHGDDLKVGGKTQRMLDCLTQDSDITVFKYSFC